MTIVAEHTPPTAVLELADAGWRCFPLRGKVPRLRSWQHAATTDPDQLRTWWTLWPAANIGALVPEQLLVVDTDPRNGGHLDDLTLPDTLSVISGRGDGGMHRYYVRPSAPHGYDHHPRPGVDIKVSGFMVMPPSIHPDSGKPYTWAGLDHPSYCNPPLRQLVTRPAPPTRWPSRPRPLDLGAKGWAGLARVVEQAPDGNLCNAFRWALWKAHQDGILDQAADDLAAAALRAGLPPKVVDYQIRHLRAKAGA